MAKTAIILAGGGMRSAHGAGFLYALATKLGITSPSLIIGSSGDAGNVAYYTTGQYNSLKRVWEELLSTPKFISPWRFWKVMDVDYVIDEVFKKQEPLDVYKLAHSPIEWRVSVTDYDSGELRYLGAKDNLDPYEILRATKAVPILYGKKIKLGGHRYIDGDVGPRFNDHVRYALKSGATNIVALYDGKDPTLLRKIIMHIYMTHVSPDMKNAILRDISASTVCLTAPGVTILCVPTQDLPLRIATNDKAHLKMAFASGEADALALAGELRTLFT